jgi:hypothetical protein
MASYGVARCSIPDTVVDYGHGLDAPIVVAFVSSHADAIDKMLVPVSTMPTPIPCLC